jgi:hypothetical protein
MINIIQFSCEISYNKIFRISRNTPKLRLGLRKKCRFFLRNCCYFRLVYEKTYEIYEISSIRDFEYTKFPNHHNHNLQSPSLYSSLNTILALSPLIPLSSPLSPYFTSISLHLPPTRPLLSLSPLPLSLYPPFSHWSRFLHDLPV